MNVSPATKAAAISDYLAGKGGYFQIALEYGINPYTFKKWVESPPGCMVAPFAEVRDTQTGTFLSWCEEVMN